MLVWIYNIKINVKWVLYINANIQQLTDEQKIEVTADGQNKKDIERH